MPINGGLTNAILRTALGKMSSIYPHVPYYKIVDLSPELIKRHQSSFSDLSLESSKMIDPVWNFSSEIIAHLQNFSLELTHASRNFSFQKWNRKIGTFSCTLDMKILISYE